jgi:hypothetical protein
MTILLSLAVYGQNNSEHEGSTYYTPYLATIGSNA